MKISLGSIVGFIAGLILGVVGMFLEYGKLQIGATRELAVISGKVELLQRFCPDAVEKSGLVEKKK